MEKMTAEQLALRVSAIATYVGRENAATIVAAEMLVPLLERIAEALEKIAPPR